MIMGYVIVEYKEQSFEENPEMITWVQLFLIRLLNEMPNREI